MPIKRVVHSLIVMAGLIVLTTSGVHAQTRASVQSQDQQTIEAWGAYPSFNRSDWGPEFTIYNRPAFETAIYDSFNLTSVRWDLQPRFNDGGTGIDQTEIQDLKKSLLSWTSRGHTDWFMTSFTPPAQFKDPPDINGSTANGTETHLRIDKEADYITFIINVLTWIKNNSLPLPVAFSLQNEPTYGPGYDGCVYTPAQYQRVCIALRQALDNAGIQAVKLIAGEGNNYGDTHTIIGDFANAQFKAAVSIVASHTYDVWSASDSYQWQESALMFQMGKPYWMTEYSPIYTGNGVMKDNGPTEIEWTLGGTRRILRELRHSGVVRYYYWQIYPGRGDVSDAGDGTGVATHATSEFLLYGDQTVNWIRMGRVYQAIIKNAPAGSRVRFMTTTDPNLKASNNNWIDMIALVSPQAMTVVLVNPTAQSKNLTVDGLLGTSLNVIRPTNADNAMSVGNLTITNGETPVSLPANSVTLLVTNKGLQNTTSAVPHALNAVSTQIAGTSLDIANYDIQGRTLRGNMLPNGIVLTRRGAVYSATVNQNLRHRSIER